MDYISNESSYEQNMGEEIQYEIDCDDCKCPKCKREFKVKGIICIYVGFMKQIH